MANSTMGKRPLVNASEFRGSGKSGGGGGGMDKAAKIKAGASIVAILVAVLFLAFYFDLFGGGNDLPPGVTAEELQAPPPEEVEKIKQEYEEELERANRKGIPAVGS
jgi:hypothetical protein